MKDPLTNEEFEPKRSNQRFARPENRTKYHNDNAKQERKENAVVDKALRQNKKVLDKRMKGKGKVTFHEEFLSGDDYNFHFFTGMCMVGTETGYCIYNYILIFEKPYVHVLRKH